MGAVGQLYQQDTHILAHRHQELAKIFRLRAAGKRFDGKTTELGHPVHKLRHVAPELRVQRVERDITILNSVMEQRGDDRIFIKAHVRKNIGHGYGMREVGLA